jgi:phosphate-selective porin OprO and OprP
MVIRTGRYVAAITALGISAVAMAAETSVEDLKAQIDALQKKVEALEAKQVSAADVDATVRAVLEDAQRRSQFMAVEGFTAGYTADRGFVLQSADGAFLLHPYMQFQFRESNNWRDNDTTGTNSATNNANDNNNGFEVRRLKYGVDGNAYTSALTYQFQWQTSSTAGSVSLEDAWARYRFQPDWAVQGGQFKDPLFHESLVSSFKQLTADRSLQNSLLEGNDNYIQGASLLYGDKGRLHSQVAFTDGFAGANSNYLDPTGGDPTDSGFRANNNKAANFGLAARVEYMVLGESAKDWKRYSTYSAQGAKDPSDLLILGAAGEWDQVGDYNAYWYTADAQWEPAAVSGLSVYGALVGRDFRVNQTESDSQNNSASDWGALIQAGYMVTTRIEPFVRYDYTRLGTMSDSTADSFGTRNIHEITAGVNYYLFGQNAKFTLDLSYLPNGSPATVSGLDISSQTRDEEQWIARAQFQLVL